MFKECRCGKCNKLLARVGEFSRIQIKCPRCGTLNHMKTESLAEVPTSPNESLGE
ncbi:Com family DNA-binding transcriptional regulator [Pseudomonas synxantha]|uniref:Com family DNA-binding transcriptional regulator n=1 Tax=Pseudomonas synxantha TaxID=47883 RepID=UPI000B42D45F|nr:Com family DNA-binding transcriptional regulator [Pseudomonas synxantha]